MSGGANFEILVNPTLIRGPIFWLRVLKFTPGATWQVEKGPAWTIVGLHSVICKPTNEKWEPLDEVVFSGTVTVQIGRAPSYPGPEGSLAAQTDEDGNLVVVGTETVTNNRTEDGGTIDGRAIRVAPDFTPLRSSPGGTIGTGLDERLAFMAGPSGAHRFTWQLKITVAAISMVQLVRSHDTGATWELVRALGGVAVGETLVLHVGPGAKDSLTAFGVDAQVAGVSWGLELANTSGSTSTYASVVTGAGS